FDFGFWISDCRSERNQSEFEMCCASDFSHNRTLEPSIKEKAISPASIACIPLELDGIWINSTSKLFFLNRPSCFAMNMPLCAPKICPEQGRRIGNRKSKITDDFIRPFEHADWNCSWSFYRTVTCLVWKFTTRVLPRSSLVPMRMSFA